MQKDRYCATLKNNINLNNHVVFLIHELYNHRMRKRNTPITQCIPDEHNVHVPLTQHKQQDILMVQKMKWMTY